MGRKKLYITLVALLALLLFLVGATVASFISEPKLEPELEEAGIREVEGVLYYPDGQPVRNYEQLRIYLDAENEVK